MFCLKIKIPQEACNPSLSALFIENVEVDNLPLVYLIITLLDYLNAGLEKTPQ